MHYNILLVDKRKHPNESQWWTRYNMFTDENLEKITKFYAHLYNRFRNYVVDRDDYLMFDLILAEDPNYDPDCGSFTFTDIKVFHPLINKELDFLIEHYDEFCKTWSKQNAV